MNGSNVPKTAGWYHDFGILKIMRVKGTTVTPFVETKVPGHWCEGAAWSRDQKKILVQCMVEKAIFVYGFDGKTLTPAGSIKVNGGPAGLRTADR